MTLIESFIIIVFMIGVLVLSGIPVAVALGFTGLFGFYAFLDKGMATTIGIITFNMMNSFIMVAIPLFVLMGCLLLRGGIGEKLYKGVSNLIHGLPGGLLHGNIMSCSIFAAICGSTTATAATIGTIAIPELEKRGYDRKLIAGSLAAGGTLGILIPPSLQFILYGVLTETSVGKLFMAGMIPGLILSGLMMTYIFIRILIQPQLQPPLVQNMNLKARLTSLVNLLPIGLLILVVLGGIYLGIMTPTESAAIGASGALILSVIYRSLSWKSLKDSLTESIRVTAMVLFIMMSANLFTCVLVNMRVPTLILDIINSLHLSPFMVLIFIIFSYLLLGCFFDAVSMTIITIPVYFPIIVKMGYDPIWFGVINVLMCEVSTITPPVGLNLYVIQGLRTDYQSKDIIWGSVPFVLVIFIMAGILIAWPEIALWLPKQMR